MPTPSPKRSASINPTRPFLKPPLTALGIPPAAYGRVVMVGDKVERDIKGANALGLLSVWLDWAPRRATADPAKPRATPSKPRWNC